MKQIKAVIFDWAGTTVDYGCMAPLQAMERAFLQQGLSVPLEDIRRPMGMLKKDHIRTILEMPMIKAQFEKVHDRPYAAADVDQINTWFEKEIFLVLALHTEVIDHVLTTQRYLNQQGIKIGSTTGYTAKMIKVVADSAKKQGYMPDFIIAGDQVKHGRPAPDMLHENFLSLQIKSPQQVIKVGDTLVDIQEGKNAGCLSIGVIMGSSMLGLTQKEVAGLSLQSLQEKKMQIKDQMFAAGADDVIDTLQELPEKIELIQKKVCREII